LLAKTRKDYIALLGIEQSAVFREIGRTITLLRGQGCDPGEKIRNIYA